MGVPLVSVCIANYNGINLIDDCIRSVKNQLGNIPLEIIVHDDASKDQSAEYIRQHYPDVLLIASHKNIGYCQSNNTMAAAAQGEYLLLLNNDAALYPDAIQTLLSEARQLQTPAILGLPQYDWETKSLLDIGSLLDPFLNSIPNFTAGEVGMVAGACLWIPKFSWDELNGFPECFGSIGEDLYLCCLARLRGYSVRAANASGYRHRVGQSFGGGKISGQRLATTYRRRSLSESNKTLVMAVTYPIVGFLLAFPAHMALLLIEGTLLSILKQDRKLMLEIYLPAIGAVWRGRKWVWRLRRTVQSNRLISTMRFFSAFKPTMYKLSMLIRYGLPELR